MCACVLTQTHKNTEKNTNRLLRRSMIPGLLHFDSRSNFRSTTDKKEMIATVSLTNTLQTHQPMASSTDLH